MKITEINLWDAAKAVFKRKFLDFSGGPMVRNPPANVGDAGPMPGQRAKIPHVSWPENQNTKQKQHGNKFPKDFSNSLRQKRDPNH